MNVAFLRLFQSVHSQQLNILFHTAVAHWIVSPLGSIFYNARNGCDVEKISVDQQLLVKYSDQQPVWHQQPRSSRSKSFQSTFFPVLILS